MSEDKIKMILFEKKNKSSLEKISGSVGILFFEKLLLVKRNFVNNIYE